MEQTKKAVGPLPRSFWKPVAASVVGNTLEWFDLAVYAYFALTIGRVFFRAQTLPSLWFWLLPHSGFHF